MNVKIVIPIYKPQLSDLEVRSLEQAYNVFLNHILVVIKPESLDLSLLQSQYPRLTIESFDDSFFKGISSYNRLMLSTCFYERFLDSDYILIYQLDAYVFKDELNEWCNKKYDYIGAPWLQRPIYRLPLVRHSLHALRFIGKKLGKPNRQYLNNRVGNGGLSLRKVQSHYKVTLSHKKRIDFFLTQKRSHFYNEDVFWATEINKKKIIFHYPDVQEALKFSFDKYPDLCYKLNGNKLPFGCHSWYKRKMKKFWQPIIGFSL